jgi:phosphatidylglycerol---prolipoprotein diacylglyceryl transferase
MFPIPYFEQPRLSIGPLTIHAFGVLVAVAVISGTEILRRRAETERLDANKAQQLLMWALVFGFVIAHLFDRFVYYPREALADPMSILKIWTSLSSFGGFLGVVIGIFVYLRRHPLKPLTWRYVDLIAYAFPFGWIFGRTGCFLAFDHPGRETAFFLAQVYKDGKVRFNLGLLEALYFIPLALVFYLLGRRRRGPGFYVGLLPLLYVPFRFFADFLRIHDTRYAGLTPGQWGCIVVTFVGAVILRNALRAGPEADEPAPLGQRGAAPSKS